VNQSGGFGWGRGSSGGRGFVVFAVALPALEDAGGVCPRGFVLGDGNGDGFVHPPGGVGGDGIGKVRGDDGREDANVGFIDIEDALPLLKRLEELKELELPSVLTVKSFDCRMF